MSGQLEAIRWPQYGFSGRSGARCGASTLRSGSAAAAEDGSGERRDAPEGPFRRSFGRVLLRRGVARPLCRCSSIAMRRALSTYFHRRVIHMIVFSRPPGKRRRAGDVWTSSSVADALRWPRKATLRAALQVLRTSSRGPCDASSITADHAPSRRTCKAVRCITLL